MGDRLEIIEIAGDPYERGRQHGEAVRGTIGPFLEYLRSSYREPGVTDEAIDRHARKHFPYIEEYSPEIANEMRGIAEGARRDLAEIVMISLIEERKSFSALLSSCTSFAATGTATADGGTYLGQTWDISFDLCSNADPFLLKVKRDGGPDFLAYTYPGMMAGAGLNDAGICMSWNSVPRLELGIGVPTHVIIEEVLRAATIGEALAAVLRANRAGCFNFVISDETEIYNVEATPWDVDISYSSTYLVHANHYVSEKFRCKQDISEVAGHKAASTIIRHHRIDRLMEERCGELDLESLQSFWGDHVNYPQSICRHPEATKEKEKIITCASWVIVPAKREWWITRGPACQKGFEKYLLDA